MGETRDVPAAPARELPAELADDIAANFTYTSLLLRTAKAPGYSGIVTLFEAQCGKPSDGFADRWRRIHGGELVVHLVDEDHDGIVSETGWRQILPALE